MLAASASASARAEILVRVGLSGTEDKLSGSLPLGQMKRLEVARALAVDPQIVLFDEPLAGLNQTEASRQMETIVAVNAQGITVVLVEHNLEEVMRSCRRLIVLNDGRVIGDGAPQEVMGECRGARGLCRQRERQPCSALSTSTAAMARSAPCMMSRSMCRAGSVFALLGPNGAGKTSTIMAIMGHVDIYAGRIVFDGVDITRRRAVDRVDLGIALVPEGRQLFSDLTVGENLTVGGYARPLAHDAAKRDRVFGYFPRLYERRGQLAGSLSGGEQQMLAIGRALMAEPRLLLVDELSLGLDAENGRSLPRRADEAERRRPEHSFGRTEHGARAGCCRSGLSCCPRACRFFPERQRRRARQAPCSRRFSVPVTNQNVTC